LNNINRDLNDKPTMGNILIRTQEFSEKPSKFSNHKTAGIDKVTNFLIKQLTNLHP